MKQARVVAAALFVALMLGTTAGFAADEAGFEPIFNGEDLTGWIGAKYVVEDGILVCPQSEIGRASCRERV